MDERETVMLNGEGATFDDRRLEQTDYHLGRRAEDAAAPEELPFDIPRD